MDRTNSPVCEIFFGRKSFNEEAYDLPAPINLNSGYVRILIQRQSPEQALITSCHRLGVIAALDLGYP